MHFQEGSRKKPILSSRGKGLHNGACVKQTSSEEPKACSPIPKNAEFYLGDDQNLTSNTKSKYSEINNSDQKCEWKCEERYEYVLFSEKTGEYRCLPQFECSLNPTIKNASSHVWRCENKEKQDRCIGKGRDAWDGQHIATCGDEIWERQNPHLCFVDLSNGKSIRLPTLCIRERWGDRDYNNIDGYE